MGDFRHRGNKKGINIHGVSLSQSDENYGRKLISLCFDLFHRVAMLLNGGGNCGSVYGVEGDWESAV